MKMKARNILVVLSALLTALIVDADVFETITLKSGNSFDGYIMKQFHDGQWHIFADASDVAIPDSIVDKVEGHGKISNIYLRPGYDDGFIAMFTDEDDENLISNVEVSESPGAIRFKYKKGPVKFAVSRENVSEIRRITRPSNQTNGVNDIVYTKDGKTYTGQISVIIPGQITKIKEKNSLISIPTRNIARISRRHLNKHSSVFQQIPLVETIEFEDGTSLQNVMIADQDYINGTFEVVDSTLIMSPRYHLSDIKSISWSKNPLYEPEFAREPQPNTVIINGKSYAISKYTRSKDNKYYVVDAGNKKYHVTPKNGKVRIEYMPVKGGKDVMVVEIDNSTRTTRSASDLRIPVGDILSNVIRPELHLEAEEGVPARSDYVLKRGSAYVVFFLGNNECVPIYVN